VPRIRGEKGVERQRTRRDRGWSMLIVALRRRTSSSRANSPSAGPSRRLRAPPPLKTRCSQSGRADDPVRAVHRPDGSQGADLYLDPEAFHEAFAGRAGVRPGQPVAVGLVDGGDRATADTTSGAAGAESPVTREPPGPAGPPAPAPTGPGGIGTRNREPTAASIASRRRLVPWAAARGLLPPDGAQS
jgi:hypothetical protein